MLYNKLMNNCFCNKPRRIGQVPCPSEITLRTVVLPANLGDDTEGAPYAPRIGMHYNTVVLYQANGAIYLYDSNGIYTNIEPGGYAELVAKVDGLAEALEELKVKEQFDVDNLQTNINNVMNKEMEDVNNLQININAEVNAREAADEAIHQRITDIQNSPDVRYIVGTYAELEDIDPAEIGDKDYARVLQDADHDGASTYYQYDLATKTWNYVGEVGDYYTKEQIDAMIGDIDSLLKDLDTGAGVTPPVETPEEEA